MFRVYSKAVYRRNNLAPGGMEQGRTIKEHIKFFDTIEDAKEYAKFCNKTRLPANNKYQSKYCFEELF